MLLIGSNSFTLCTSRGNLVYQKRSPSWAQLSHMSRQWTKARSSTDWVANTKDLIILVMGPTGVGKSTFINTASGREVTRVGHGLSSCTNNLVPVAVPYPGDDDRRVVFVDTPGFDDTFESDIAILQRIANWMEHSYRDKNNVAGIIYLHEITQARMLGTMRKNFAMFTQLCGIDAASNIILATTKWQDMAEAVGRQREAQLKQVYWAELIDKGSSVERFHDTYSSAWNLVDSVVKKMPLRHVQIQRELVDLDKVLAQTAAGKALRGELKEALEKQRALAEALCQEPRTPELEEKYREATERTRRTLEELKSLKIPIGRMITSWFTQAFRL